MIIAKQYELSHALPESNFQSFHARHVVTGRQVMVHLVTNSCSPGRTLADIIAGLNFEGQAQLLDAGEHDGISYLVTVPIPGFTTLPAWLGPGSGAEVPSAQSANDLAFTLFNQPSAKVPFAATPPPQKADDPGEFTQFFRRPPQGQLPQPFAVPPPAVPGGPTVPGEFTLLFGAPHPSGPFPAQSPAPPPMPEVQPWEASRQLFPSPFPAPSRPEEPLSSSPPPERSSFFHPRPSPPALHHSASVDSMPAHHAPTVPVPPARSSLTPVWVGVISGAVTLGVLAILFLILRGWR